MGEKCSRIRPGINQQLNPNQGISQLAAQHSEGPLDLTSCDREEVQFIGAIQPHGMLLALDEPNLIISAASSNTRHRLGRSASEILNLTIGQALPKDEAEWIRERLRETDPGSIPVQLGPVLLRDCEYEVFAHRIDGRTILEFEQALGVKPHPGKLYADVRACMSELQSAIGVENFLGVAVRHVRKITGFDRVLAFQFLEDGTGHALGEDRHEDLESLLGMHFPPGDVPAPARRILSLVWVRHQPDIAYTEVPIETARPGAQSLDLSYSMLRSTSATCNRYYLNMGVHAKLLLALLNRGEIWGLLICQHRTAREVAHETRLACETIAHAVSLSIADKEKTAEAREAARARLNAEAVARKISETSHWAVPLEEGLLSAVPSGGAAALTGDGLILRGATPSAQQVRALAEWLEARPPAELDSVYSSNCLPARFAAAREFQDFASGMLAVRIAAGEYLMWFRPETPYEVS